MIVPVLFLDVADHLVAPGFAEIDVEVGHRHALGVEEPLEQQAQLQWIEIGDRQRPGDERTSARSAPRPHRNALRPRQLADTGPDQELAGKPHTGDNATTNPNPTT